MIVEEIIADIRGSRYESQDLTKVVGRGSSWHVGGLGFTDEGRDEANRERVESAREVQVVMKAVQLNITAGEYCGFSYFKKTGLQVLVEYRWGDEECGGWMILLSS